MHNGVTGRAPEAHSHSTAEAPGAMGAQTSSTSQVANESPSVAAPQGGETELNVGLLVVFFVIVALVCAQNLWLRRRAEREPSVPEQVRDA